jgi:hypothetical protein
METEATKIGVMIDALNSSERQRIISSDLEEERKAILSPATAALEKFSGLPQRERAELRNRCYPYEDWEDDNVRKKRSHIFDMSELFNVSLPLDGALEFPRIAWAQEEDDLMDKEKNGLGSKRSTSFADTWMARRQASRLVSRCSSTTSLLHSSLGKRNRRMKSYTSNRLVRSIAVDSNLAMLESSSIHPLDRESSVSNYYYHNQSFHSNIKLDEQQDRSTVFHMNSCLSIYGNSKM